MKKVISVLCVFAVAAVIVFSMAACGSSGSGDPSSPPGGLVITDGVLTITGTQDTIHFGLCDPASTNDELITAWVCKDNTKLSSPTDAQTGITNAIAKAQPLLSECILWTTTNSSWLFGTTGTFGVIIETCDNSVLTNWLYKYYFFPSIEFTKGCATVNFSASTRVLLTQGGSQIE